MFVLVFFCNICNTWVHPKCNQLNYKDFKLFQKTNPDESWTCIKCNSEIFPFNNKSYSNFVPSQNNNIDNLKSFFNELNSLDNTLSSTDEDSPVVNCKYYETEEFKILFSKTKSFSAFHLNLHYPNTLMNLTHYYLFSKSNLVLLGSLKQNFQKISLLQLIFLSQITL